MLYFGKERILLPQLLRVVFNLHYYNRMCFSCSSFHFQELDLLMVKMSPNFRDTSTYHWILLPRKRGWPLQTLTDAVPGHSQGWALAWLAVEMVALPKQEGWCHTGLGSLYGHEELEQRCVSVEHTEATAVRQIFCVPLEIPGVSNSREAVQQFMGGGRGREKTICQSYWWLPLSLCTVTFQLTASLNSFCGSEVVRDGKCTACCAARWEVTLLQGRYWNTLRLR